MLINRIRHDIAVLGDALEVPGIGHLPVNAYVLLASEPVVIDTGLSLPAGTSWTRSEPCSTPPTSNGCG